MSKHDFYRCDRCTSVFTPKDPNNKVSILFPTRTIDPAKEKNIKKSFDDPSRLMMMMIPIQMGLIPHDEKEPVDNRGESDLCPKCEQSLVIWFNSTFEEEIKNEEI